MQDMNKGNKRDMQITFGPLRQLGWLSAQMKQGLNGACKSCAEDARYLDDGFLADEGTGAGAPVNLSLSRIPTATLYTCEYVKITEFAKGSPYPIDPTHPSQADLGRLRHLRGI
jgi:hypothetical protein